MNAAAPATLGAPSPAVPPPGSQQWGPLPFQFTGRASEYFRIWIVNTLLTIVTLGIYSAWAKVRTKQYFHRNTRVGGACFDYLGDPIAILKGRVIVVGFLGVLVWSQYYSPLLYLAMALVLFFATPWVAVKSLAFNARNSAYRKIRFAFPGRVGEGYAVYLKTSLVYVATCGLGYPWAQWKLTEFVLTRHYWGDLQFSWRATHGQYFKAYLIALALTIPGYLVMFGGVFILVQVSSRPDMLTLMIPGILLSLYLLIPGSYLRAELANLTMGGLAVGPHSFASTQNPVELFKLYVTNALAIIFSLGLAIPWARVRLAAYRAQTLTLHAAGDLFSRTLLAEDASAVGEGMSDLGDFDLGIGV